MRAPPSYQTPPRTTSIGKHTGAYSLHTDLLPLSLPLHPLPIPCPDQSQGCLTLLRQIPGSYGRALPSSQLVARPQTPHLVHLQGCLPLLQQLLCSHGRASEPIGAALERRAPLVEPGVQRWGQSVGRESRFCHRSSS